MVGDDAGIMRWKLLKQLASLLVFELPANHAVAVASAADNVLDNCHAESTDAARSRSDASALVRGKEATMNQREGSETDLPHKDQKEIEEEAKRSRKELDKVPPPGTDPMHEGP